MLKRIFRQMMITGSVICAASIVSFGQWTTSGTNIYSSNTGNVGIGSSAPTHKLEVVGAGMMFRSVHPTSFTNFKLYNSLNSSTRSLEMNYAGSSYASSLLSGGPTGEAGSISTTGAYPLLFGTGNTLRMMINSSGNIGIGMNSPSQKLDVIGRLKFRSDNTNSSGVWFTGNDGTESAFVGQTGISSSDPVGVWHGGSWRLLVLNNGNIGVGTASPSNRLEVAGSTLNRISAIVSSDVQTGFQAKKTGTNATDWEFYVPAASTDFRFYNSTNGSDVLTLKNNGNVGIGTTTPGTRLEVSGGIVRISTNTYGLLQVGAYNSTDNFGYVSSAGQTGGTGLKFQTTDGPSTGNGVTRMTITNAGNVGIGTTSPGAKLEVYGLQRITSGSGGYLQLGALNTSTDNYGYISSAGQSNGAGLKFETTSGAGSATGVTRMMITSDGSVGINTTPSSTYKLDVNGYINAVGLYVNGQPFTGGSSQWTTSGTNAYFGLAGNVGIGSTNPDAKLTVNGTIHAKEVRVDLSVPGPDYVFDKDYQLLSLDDVRAYIEKHHHLPDVPSAAEMEKNGVNVSEMNMILLRKVEELTLHLIELKSELETIKAKR